MTLEDHWLVQMLEISGTLLELWAGEMNVGNPISLVFILEWLPSGTGLLPKLVFKGEKLSRMEWIFVCRPISEIWNCRRSFEDSPQSDWKMKLFAWCIISFYLSSTCEHSASSRWILSQHLFSTNFLSFMPCWHKISHAYI